MSDDKQAQYERGKGVAIRFDDQNIYVILGDGRVIGNPLSWHPWLAAATSAERQKVRLYHLSVWWPELDNGLDIQGMMQGVVPRTAEKAPVNDG